MPKYALPEMPGARDLLSMLRFLDNADARRDWFTEAMAMVAKVEADLATVDSLEQAETLRLKAQSDRDAAAETLEQARATAGREATEIEATARNNAATMIAAAEAAKEQARGTNARLTTRERKLDDREAALTAREERVIQAERDNDATQARLNAMDDDIAAAREKLRRAHELIG